MGKQTDARINSVIDQMQKVQVSARRIDQCNGSLRNAWDAMMKAYDTEGGFSASKKSESAIRSAVTNYNAAVEATRNHAAEAAKAMADFDSFVVAKDKGTWNPLAKKSIGKAKKFVQTNKPIVAALVKTYNDMSSMDHVVDIAKGVYF